MTTSLRAIEAHTLPRPNGLIEVDTVLDIGAGIRPMQWYVPKRHICVDAHEPYVQILRANGYEAYTHTAAEALERFTDADAIYMLDVIEHLHKHEARAVIENAQRLAQQVIIYTPLGFVEQNHDAWGLEGDFWQTHRSSFLPEDFPAWQTQIFQDEGFFAICTRNQKPCITATA